MSRRPAQLPRACAAALALLWLALPLLGMLHAGEHAHRYCPEHQALEEVAAGPDDAASLGARAGAEERGVIASAAGTEAEHVRCALSWAGSRQALLPARPASDEVGAPRGAQVLSEGRGPRTSISVLALAPKASPPLR